MENITRKVILLDGDALLYYESFKDQTLDKAIENINDRLLKICEDNGTYDYIGFLTVGKCFRYNIAKAKPYKGTRPVEKPVLLTQLKQYLIDVLKFTWQDQLEADDCVAYWQHNLGHETVICSPDKDVLFTIPGTHYNYQWKSFTDKGRFVTTSEEEANEFLWTQTAQGDSTDNIPGIPKVGEKTVEKWIKENNGKVGLETLIFTKYVETFGAIEGLLRFTETFRLVYMLRTPEDVMRETGLILDKPVINRLVRD